MNFETKFSLKDRVWFMKNNKPKEVIISAIHIFFVGTGQDQTKYNASDVTNSVSWLDHTDLFERILFESKSDLLKSLFGDTECKGKNCHAINGVGHSSDCEQEHDAVTRLEESPELFPGTRDALSKLST